MASAGLGLDTTTKLSSPYEQCLNSAFAVLGEHTKEHFPSERVGIVCCLDAPERKIEAVYARNSEKYPQFISISAGISKDIVPLQCADLGVGQLRESWRAIAAGEADDLPWGAMPRGKDTKMRSTFWSLRQAAVLMRGLKISLERAKGE